MEPSQSFLLFGIRVNPTSYILFFDAGMLGQIVEYSTARDIWASLNQEYESLFIAKATSLNSDQL